MLKNLKQYKKSMIIQDLKDKNSQPGLNWVF